MGGGEGEVRSAVLLVNDEDYAGGGREGGEEEVKAVVKNGFFKRGRNCLGMSAFMRKPLPPARIISPTSERGEKGEERCGSERRRRERR